MYQIKRDFRSLSVKDLITLVLAIGCMAAAIVTIFLSLYIPPKGEVHSSVLTYFGISSAFCGSLLGISAHYSNELNRFKSNVMDTLRDRNECSGRI